MGVLATERWGDSRRHGGAHPYTSKTNPGRGVVTGQGISEGISVLVTQGLDHVKPHHPGFQVSQIELGPSIILLWGL